MPDVSVLLPVFNAQETLRDTLQSIRHQTFDDYELIVVLNGCDDESLVIAQQFASSDRRVVLAQLPTPNLVGALNAGLALCTSPVIARIDADDLMMPDRLALQAKALQDNPGWDFVTCGVQHLPAVDGTRGDGMARHVEWLNSLSSPHDIFTSRFIDAPIAHPSVMFRARVVRSLGGYREGDFPEDYDLWLRMFELGHRCGRVPQVLVQWRDHASRLTRTDARYRDEAHRSLRHRFLLSGPARNRHCRIWGAGPFGRLHARKLTAQGAAIDDLIDIDPKKIGRRVAGGLPVVGVDQLGSPDGRLVLLAVGSLGARPLIEQVLHDHGFVIERDYLPLQ